MELIFKGKLHCLWGYFRKQTGREDVQTSLKCFCASRTLACLLPITIQYNGFLRIETQLEVANELFAKG